MRRFAFVLYLVFVASWFLHLGERVAALGAARVDLILLVSIAALILVTKKESPPGGDPRIRRLILGLTAYAVVTTPFVQWPGSVLLKGLPAFIKAFVFYYFTAELVTTESQLRKLLFVFIAAQAFRVMEPLYLHVTQGYWGSFATMWDGGQMETMNRLAGAPSDVINPNGLAFVILTVIPFFHYLGPMTTRGALLYVAFLPAALWALVLTGSRSGLLGLAITILVVWWQSQRKLLLGAVVVVAGVITLQMLPGDLSDRYLSIFDSNTKNAATAEGRVQGTVRDLQVALRRPFFGHGLGTSLEANANFAKSAQRSHNLYTEVAQELGFVGLAIVLVLLATIARAVGGMLRAFMASNIRGGLIFRLSLAVRTWFGMNILFSFASYGLSSYEWYFLAGLSEVMGRYIARVACLPEPAAGAPGPGMLRSPGSAKPARRAEAAKSAAFVSAQFPGHAVCTSRPR